MVSSIGVRDNTIMANGIMVCNMDKEFIIHKVKSKKDNGAKEYLFITNHTSNNNNSSNNNTSNNIE